MEIAVRDKEMEEGEEHTAAAAAAASQELAQPLLMELKEGVAGYKNAHSLGLDPLLRKT